MLRGALILMTGFLLANCALTPSWSWLSPLETTGQTVGGASSEAGSAATDRTGELSRREAEALNVEPPVQSSRVAQAGQSPRPKAGTQQAVTRDVGPTGSVNLLTIPSPVIGSPEWKRQQAEAERKETRLDALIRGICNGC
jgi:hypothetical protein